MSSISKILGKVTAEDRVKAIYPKARCELRIGVTGMLNYCILLEDHKWPFTVTQHCESIAWSKAEEGINKMIMEKLES